MTQFENYFGTGVDGSFNNGELETGKEYNFSDFYLDTEVIVTAGETGGKIVIKCRGAFEIAEGGKITINPLDAVKDSASIEINGANYFVTSIDGVPGLAGGGRYGGGGGSPNGVGGSRGSNGLDGGYGTAGQTDGRYGSTGGAAGPGGLGQGTGEASGGGGGGGGYGMNYGGSSGHGGYGGFGGAGAVPVNYQNGIVIAAPNPIVNGTIEANGATPEAATDGTKGGPVDRKSSGGGGGGGGAGGKGNGGGRVLFFTIDPVSFSISAAAGLGSAGGLGGGLSGGFIGYGGTEGGEGTPGTAGTDGTGGDLTVETVTVEPQINNQRVTNIFAGAFFEKCEVFNIGSSDIIEKGVVWGLSTAPTKADNFLLDESEGLIIDVEIRNLQPDTLYYVRGYAETADGIGWTTETQVRTHKAFVPITYLIN